MKFFLILCLSYMFLYAKCGLIKNFLGTVSDEVHKLTEGNVLVNTVHGIVEAKKGMISDLSDLINPNNYLKPNNNNHFNKNTAQQVQPQNNEFLITVTKPTVNFNEIIPPLNIKPTPGNGPIPDYSITVSNKVDHIVQTSTELIKPIIFNQNAGNDDINEYEFGIEPRIARQISPYDSEKSGVEETDPNQNDTVINSENESILINFDAPLNNTGVVITEVVNGCPEELEIAADGSCVLPFDLNPGNDTKSEGHNRAAFEGGCLFGYAHAADGTCQEIIYD